MAKNYLDRWSEIDKEFESNQKLDEVKQLVKEGIVSQKVYEELVKTTRESALGIKKTIDNSTWKEKALIAGHLYKRVSKKKWRPRWFVLYNDRLEQYKTRKDTKCLDSIAITSDHYASDYSLKANESQDSVRPHGFMLSNFESTIYMAAETKEVKRYWLHTLQAIIKKHKEIAKLEDEPLLLDANSRGKGSFDERVNQYRASVRKRATVDPNHRNKSLVELVNIEKKLYEDNKELMGNKKNEETAGNIQNKPLSSTSSSSNKKRNTRKSKRGTKKSKRDTQKPKRGTNREKGKDSKRGTNREKGKKPQEKEQKKSKKRFNLRRQSSSAAIPTKVVFDDIIEPEESELEALRGPPPAKIRIQYAEMLPSTKEQKAKLLDEAEPYLTQEEDAENEESEEQAKIGSDAEFNKESKFMKELSDDREMEEKQTETKDLDELESSYSRKHFDETSTMLDDSVSLYLVDNKERENVDKRLGPPPSLSSFLQTYIPSIVQAMTGANQEKKAEDEVEKAKEHEDEDEDDKKDSKKKEKMENDEEREAPLSEKIKEVVNDRFGLLVRSNSYEENVMEEVSKAKGEKTMVDTKLEATQRINDILRLQDDVLEEELEEARRNGDVEKIKELEEEIKATERYSTELERESAEVWVQKHELEETLRAKERELAEAQAAQELAAELSRGVAQKIQAEMDKVEAAMNNAALLNKQAEEAMAEAEKAAQKVYDRTKQERRNIEKLEKDMENEESDIAKKAEELAAKEMEIKRKTTTVGKTAELLEDLEVVTQKKLQAEEEVKRIRRERNSLAEKRVQANAKIAALKKTLVSESEEMETPPKKLKDQTSNNKANISLHAAEMYSQMKDVGLDKAGDAMTRKTSMASKGRFKREEAATAHAKFMAQWAEQDNLSQDELLPKEEKDPNKFDYDDYVESYYTGEEDNGSFDEFNLEGDDENEVEEKPDEKQEELRKRLEQLSAEQRKAAKESFFDANIELLVKVITDVGGTDSKGRKFITFAHLYDEYFALSDGLVGILQKAKDTGRVYYEGDSLLIDEDGNKIITVLS